MSTTTNIAFKFLTELDSKNMKETFESLNALIEHLENKLEPNPFEVQIFDNANQTLEKLKTLQGLLKNYVAESDNINKGNKLQNLYERTNYVIFE